ncbi:MAG: NAD(P)/FAD-dependent oxidoreductase [Alphaproteobacteria bacterium]|nr:NAD(P)/FAD-dependent oxidoreductase [Alphaproteobacteria bacterium]
MIDAAVVGGGLGGLAAAIGLARGGLRVTVFEAGEAVGGYAANFERGAYRFDASLHLLDAAEPGCANREIWSALGLDRRVATAAPSLLRRERWPDHDVRVPQGTEGWIEALAAAFPSERAGLRSLVDHALRVHAAVLDDRACRLAGRPPPPLRPPLSELMDTTAGAVLRSHLKDPRLVAIAGSLSCYLGLGCDELAAIPYLTMIASYHHHSGSYPIGGSGAIAAALADELRSLGGEIRVGSRVVRVLTEWGRASGVVLEGGEQVRASVVVVNGSPAHTVSELLAPGDTDRRAAARLRRAPLGTSVVKVWLGLSRDPDPDELPYETFFRGTYGTTTEDGGLEDIGVVLPHRLDPGCAPAGGAVVAVTIGAEPTLDEEERHRALAEQAVDRVRRRWLPWLAEAEVVRVVATPRTFHRYTSNPGGCIHGFRPIPSQSGPRRTPIGGLVDGLWHVGGWTYAGSGFLPSMTTGLTAAAAILGGLR